VGDGVEKTNPNFFLSLFPHLPYFGGTNGIQAGHNHHQGDREEIDGFSVNRIEGIEQQPTHRFENTHGGSEAG
jgi:hypothetical protein